MCRGAGCCLAATGELFIPAHFRPDEKSTLSTEGGWGAGAGSKDNPLPALLLPQPEPLSPIKRLFLKLGEFFPEFS